LVTTSKADGKVPPAGEEFIRGFVCATREALALLRGVTPPGEEEATLARLLGRAERYGAAGLSPEQFVKVTVDLGDW
jgi:hypothetical protein